MPTASPRWICYNLVSFALRLVDCGAWPTADFVVWRHGASDLRMDRKSDHGSLRLGTSSPTTDPRSGSDLWQRRHTPIARHGHPGQAYRTSLALAERLCRTADRIDPA